MIYLFLKNIKIVNKVNQMNIKFSIIMPVYNVSDFLTSSITSVLRQTYSHFEIIIVNDGSTDASYSILEKMSKVDRRITVINQENKGLSAARNVGLNIASGDYIFFMDSDDTIKNDLLLTVYNTICRMKVPNTIMIGYEAFNNKGNFLGKRLVSGTYSGSEVVHSILTGQLENYVWQFIIPKFLLDKDLRFLEGVLFEDIDWTARFLSNISSVMYVSDSLYCYRVRQGSITHTRSNKKSRDLLKVLESLSKTITNKFPEELVNFQVWRKPLDITVYYDCSILGWENVDSKGQLFLRICNFDGNGLTVKQKIKLLLIKVKIVDLISYFLLKRRKC